MTGTISWVGNRVVDPRTSRQTPSAVAAKTAQIMPEQAAEPPLVRQGPPPATEPGYIPYFLTQNIGKNVRAEFILGSSQYADKTGLLVEVGINYFVLEDVNSRTYVMCDLYSVKFVTILQYTPGE